MIPYAHDGSTTETKHADPIRVVLDDHCEVCLNTPYSELVCPEPGCLVAQAREQFRTMHNDHWVAELTCAELRNAHAAEVAKNEQLRGDARRKQSLLEAAEAKADRVRGEVRQLLAHAGRIVSYPGSDALPETDYDGVTNPEAPDTLPRRLQAERERDTLRAKLGGILADLRALAKIATCGEVNHATRYVGRYKMDGATDGGILAAREILSRAGERPR